MSAKDFFKKSKNGRYSSAFGRSIRRRATQAIPATPLEILPISGTSDPSEGFNSAIQSADTLLAASCHLGTTEIGSFSSSRGSTLGRSYCATKTPEEPLNWGDREEAALILVKPLRDPPRFKPPRSKKRYFYKRFRPKVPHPSETPFGSYRR